jgi:hypothetical protein
VHRILVPAGVMTGLLVASPAQAFGHGSTHNPYLHAVLDVLALLVVASPILAAYLWGPRRRGLLLTLIAGVQAPVAVVAFTPFVDPRVHLAASTVALAVTAGAIRAVRRTAEPATVSAAG